MTTDQTTEIILCRLSPSYFILNYVMTQHPLQGIILYPTYPFLQSLIQAIHTSRLLVVPKSRQMLVTWTAIGYFLWKALFHGPGLTLFISRSEFCAEELIGRALLIFQHLPPFMQPKLLAKSREQISFEGINSRILSLPAVPDAPRMHSPSSVFWDECAFTPFDDQIWTALQPCLQSGGQFLAVSSSNGPKGLFHHLVTNSDDLGFTCHQVHYKDHPDHSPEWESQARQGLSASQWAREMDISFDAPSIIIYDEFTPDLHITKHDQQFNYTDPIFRAVDFGFLHPFVLWIAQPTPDHLLIFDEFPGENLTTAQLALKIQSIDFNHGIDELNVSWTACDPAGAQSTDAGISQAETLQRHNIKLRYRASHISAGIELVKSFLLDAQGIVHLRIHPRCEHFIHHIQHYRWDPKRELPVKDGITDHAMDALRYFFVNFVGKTIAPSPRVAGSDSNL